MLAAARLTYQYGDVTYFGFDRGVLFSSPNLWITNRWLTMVVNTALILVTTVSWLSVIQLFNPGRSSASLSGSYYLLMIMAVPELMDQLNTGTFLAAVLPGCLALLWSTYDNISKIRHVFLLFAILSVLSMSQYTFALYIPVFIIGCAQMKIFCLRTVLACLMGIITPWWIAFGLGLVKFSDIHFPEMTFFFSSTGMDGLMGIVAVAIVTAILFVIAWLSNVMQVLNLNANLRAYNGTLTLVSFVSLICMFGDFVNGVAYLPALMLMTSYQLSFMFGKSTHPHRYIPIIIIMLLYIGFYVLRQILL